MKKYRCVQALMLVAISVFLLCGCNDSPTAPDNEGISTVTKQTTWLDSAGNTHTADFYTAGKSAGELKFDSSGIQMNHIFIDDIPVYEMYANERERHKILFLFHGQGSRKEEYLQEMENYVNAGYLCVTVDLRGHGERVTAEPVMSVQLTVDTAKDIDTLLEYYHTVSYANADQFALMGLSQGGSVCYWYAAFGKHQPSAMVIGSSTPDFTYQKDDAAIKNGEMVDSLWSEAQLQEFINKNNPVQVQEEWIGIPILAGNGLSDPIISYKGTEQLEKAKIEAGVADSVFMYFNNTGHEVTEAFMMKVIPFLNKAF